MYLISIESMTLITSNVLHEAFILDEVYDTLQNYIEKQGDCKDMFATALQGGKRLRSVIMYQVFGDFDVYMSSTSIPTSNAERKALADATSAIEMIHAASLVIDDLPMFDGALFRRKTTSVWKLWGEQRALGIASKLLMDALQILVLLPMCESRHKEVIKEIISTINKMWDGQLKEEAGSTASSTKPLRGGESKKEGCGECAESKRDIAYIESIHSYKTASLFILGVRIALELRLYFHPHQAVYIRDRAKKYLDDAKACGVAFQRLDDALDFDSDDDYKNYWHVLQSAKLAECDILKHTREWSATKNNFENPTCIAKWIVFCEVQTRSLLKKYL